MTNGVFAQSVNTQTHDLNFALADPEKSLSCDKLKSYGSKSLSSITQSSNHKQKPAITVINKYGARYIFLAMSFEVKRLNPWFPLDKRHAATKIVPDWPIAELFT